ncbi:3-phosphoshikimate 1-carboxyvinyltransferase [Candidatus Peregrinibacteria bacterium]|nr:3-phosphoshikimate 1-carboxyvinyltransferase [Candidatus Peregrinibacteria bacterium]
MPIKDMLKITPPGSKSIANRALILAALTKNKTTLKNIPKCDDTAHLIKGLKKFGIKTARPIKSNKPINIYTGNAGTATRFLTALATLTEKNIIITGDKRIQQRPIAPLTKALNQLGAKVSDKNGYPPITIYPQKPEGGIITIPGNISSQFISALLIIAPFLEKKTIINIDQKLYSQPYVQTTIKVMQSFNLKIMNKNFRQFIINPQKTNPPKNYTIEGDASSASYIGAYAALHPDKKISIKNIHKNSIQGDILFLNLLEKMGCKISHEKHGITIVGPKKLKSLGRIDMNKTPDLVMTFAVLALFTTGITTITNIANLRIKETDRIAALKTELTKLNAKVETGKDFISITPPKALLKEALKIDAMQGSKLFMPEPYLLIRRARNCAADEAVRDFHSFPKKSVTIETYNDHRIAMSFGILADILPNLQIKNPGCVSKSYTNFWKDLARLKKS